MMYRNLLNGLYSINLYDIEEYAESSKNVQ